jgi:hypothetical protein
LTRHRDSPRAALLIEQLCRAAPTCPMCARQRRIQIWVAWRAQRHQAAFGEGQQPRWRRRIRLSLSRRQQLSHDFPPVGDKHALAQTHTAKVFAKPILQVADTHGFHENQCSHKKLHCQEIARSQHAVIQLHRNGIESLGIGAFESIGRSSMAALRRPTAGSAEYQNQQRRHHGQVEHDMEGVRSDLVALGEEGMRASEHHLVARRACRIGHY